MRLAGAGLVNRGAPLSFRFNGRLMEGFQGDTLASALLANGVRTVARSFKYHRPRGILTAGSAEPSALVSVGRGADWTPNVRATVQELYDGLEAHGQNAWPTLSHDLLAVNDLLAPFLGAGFYYKTFMWPKRFWEWLYEPMIRRAAGLGKLSGAPGRARYGTAFAHCDLLVIGGGPAGLISALTASRAGVDVILADEDNLFGGRLLGEREEVGGHIGHLWVDSVVEELRSMDNVRLMPRTTVTGAYDQGTYGALERVALHVAEPGAAPLETFWRIAARRAILATGAHERPIAFPMNDRPGIMLAGAVRAYANRFGVSAGMRVAVFGNNDDAHRTAWDLSDAGVEITAVIDSRPDAQVGGGIPIHRGARVIGTSGRHGINRITVSGEDGVREMECDCLAVSGGWSPVVHLTCHMGGKPVWKDDIAAFVPAEGAVPGLSPVGAAKGVFSTAGCLADALRTTTETLRSLGREPGPLDLPEAEDAEGSISPLWLVGGKGRVWLDMLNDVTVKDISLAVQEGFRSAEHMKRYTTQGMTTDQGKLSNVTALAILADATGTDIAEVGTTVFRPPYTPITISAIGAGGAGGGFAPERRMTTHVASLQRSAPMVEAGLWYRPGYFPAPGETTWRESCDREVSMVRERVGVADVSTLGKFDIQGPDAGRFLDFVYANTFSNLGERRVRYGLMLREDGFVMDDGTAARLGDGRWVMTTTTAAAERAILHLEWVRQALMPEADVRITPVTEQWAQFAVAGPRARDVLGLVLDTPLNPDEWPFMSCGDVRVMGVSGRLFRISFSGEEGYEIAVPARFGESLFRVLAAQAESVGGGPYGMEALNVLRIEKGFITHAEIDGRATADDIGMGRMVSREKDCVGRAMSERPGLSGSCREQLVGLRPAQRDGKLIAGAHLFAVGKEAVSVNSEGYITSACHSPTLGHHLALGFLTNGRSRHGGTVRMVDHLRGLETICEVSDPVFLDPDGERMRG